MHKAKMINTSVTLSFPYSRTPAVFIVQRHILDNSKFSACSYLVAAELQKENEEQVMMKSATAANFKHCGFPELKIV